MAKKSPQPAWDAGTRPWFRTGQNRMTTCVFCGANSAIVSHTDERADSGRLELYCLNGTCDAREVAVIVLRDGAGASRRADVRALDAVDDARATVRGLILTRGGLADYGSEAVERRVSDRDLIELLTPPPGTRADA